MSQPIWPQPDRDPEATKRLQHQLALNGLPPLERVVVTLHVEILPRDGRCELALLGGGRFLVVADDGTERFDPLDVALVLGHNLRRDLDSLWRVGHIVPDRWATLELPDMPSREPQ